MTCHLWLSKTWSIAILLFRELGVVISSQTSGARQSTQVQTQVFTAQFCERPQHAGFTQWICDLLHDHASHIRELQIYKTSAIEIILAHIYRPSLEVLGIDPDALSSTLLLNMPRVKYLSLTSYSNDDSDDEEDDDTFVTLPSLFPRLEVLRTQSRVVMSGLLQDRPIHTLELNGDVLPEPDETRQHAPWAPIPKDDVFSNTIKQVHPSVPLRSLAFYIQTQKLQPLKYILEPLIRLEHLNLTFAQNWMVDDI